MFAYAVGSVIKIYTTNVSANFSTANYVFGVPVFPSYAYTLCNATYLAGSSAGVSGCV